MTGIEAAAAYKITALLVVGTAILVSRNQTNNVPALDDADVQLSERGSRAPTVMGRDQVAPVFVWAGNTSIVKEKVSSGGKGSPSAEQDIFYQEGVHVLATSRNPRGLRTIRQNGEKIWEGYITPSSAPSGTQIDLGAEGTFEVRWGLSSDAADTWAGDPSRIDLESRFPGLARVNWRRKRIGQILSWPQFTYEFEATPEDPTGTLSDIEAWTVKDATPDDLDTINIYGVVGTGTTQYFVLPFNEDYLTKIFPGTDITINGVPTITNGQTYTVSSVFQSDLLTLNWTSLFPSQWSTNPCTSGNWTSALLSNFYKVVVVTVQESISSTANLSSGVICQSSLNNITNWSTPIGTGLVQLESSQSGANVGYCVSQLCFAPAPFGAGMDEDLWDMPSLKQLAERGDTEQYLTTVTVQQGNTWQDALNDLARDFGFFIVQSPVTGLLEFRLFRPDLVNVTEIPATALQGEPIERGQIISPGRTRRVVFSYGDRLNCYRDRTIELSDDGMPKYGGVVADEDVRITTTRDRESAIQSALRQEAVTFLDLSDIDVEIGFEGRRLGPGDFFRLPDEAEPRLILKSTVSDSLTGASHEATSSGYAALVSPLVLADAELTSGSATELAIDQYALWILPSALKVTAQTYEAVLLWTRSSSSEFQATLNLSVDNITYSPFSTESTVMTGGVLQDSLAASATTSNPQFEISGPDLANVQNLEALGATSQQQQLLVIGDFSTPSSVEVCSVASVNQISTTEATLGTLQRGLYATTDQAHPAGTPFFIVQTSSWNVIADPVFFQNAQLLYYKAQPLGSGTPPSIIDIQAQVVTPGA